MTTPTALRDAGMAQAEDHADPRLVLMVDALIQGAIDDRQRFSANTIRHRMPVVGRGLVGARVRAFATRRPRVMVKVGEEPSTLASTHAKNVAVYMGVTPLTPYEQSVASLGLIREIVRETDPVLATRPFIRCHCGERVRYGFDGDPTHHRGMCEHCDAVRCDAYPGECGR